MKKKTPGWVTYSAIADIGSSLNVKIELDSPVDPDDPRCDVVLARHGPDGMVEERLEGLCASELDDLAANLVAAIRVARDLSLIPDEDA